MAWERLPSPAHCAARQVYQLTVEHEYTQFVDHVAQSRNQPFEAIDVIAQGRVWAAGDAQQRGLVDRLGLLDDAVKAAAERAQLGDKYSYEYLDVELSWRQVLAQQVSAISGKLMHALAPEMRLLSVLGQQVSPLQKEMQRLQRFATSRNTYYYCACSLE
jgi:protease-4